MTVKDVIAKLQTLNPNSNVKIVDYTNPYAGLGTITEFIIQEEKEILALENASDDVVFWCE